MAERQRHILEVWGDFACFTRREMKVERYSYPCPTPSAARGIFEAIYFKPQFYWQIERIEFLSYPSYIALRRNEVKEKVSHKAVKKWMKGEEEPQPIFADADKSITGNDNKGRTQRQTMAIRNPRYRITACIVPRPGFESEQVAYDSQFVRRASCGKCFYQPAFGCREFVAFFRYVPASERLSPPVDYNQDLGWMLYDVFDLRKRQGSDAPPFITVFRAQVIHGVLEVPPFESDLVRKTGKPLKETPTMLHHFRDYAIREGIILPPGLQRKPIKWLLIFSAQGQFIAAHDMSGGQETKAGNFHECHRPK